MTNAPLYNIDGSVVNVDSSNFSGTAFTNRIIPSWVNPNVMPEPHSNVQAAASYIPCRGGSKKKHLPKIKKMSIKYKMATKKRRSVVRRKLTKLRKSVKGILKKSKYRKRNKSKSRRSSKRTKKVRFHKGGFWNQYGQNVPNTPTYSTGGVLSANNSAEANPVPYTKLSNCTNCIDNYDHVTNKGNPTFNYFS